MGLSTLIFLILSILVAAFIRGYSGFGFAMIGVVALSIVLEPVQVVPVILMLDVIASLWLLPGVWSKIDWKTLSWLSVGVFAGTPAGVFLLANMPANLMRGAIAVVVLILTVFLWKGYAATKMPGRVKTAATGIASGVLNGSSGVGGPPVILFYFSSPAGVAVSRASLIAFFFGTDVLAFIMSAFNGLVTAKTLFLGGMLIIPLMIGIAVGGRLFSNTQPDSFRKKVLLLLMVLSVTALARSVLSAF